MAKFSSFVKRIKRRWILEPDLGPSDPTTFKREEERATRELTLSVEPAQHTDLEPIKSRKIPKKSIEQARGAHRGPVLQTINYQYENGKVVTTPDGNPVLLDDVQPNEPFLMDKV